MFEKILKILGLCSWAGRGLIAAFLPSPERDRVVAGYPISPPRWSVFVGLIEGTVGFLSYIMGALAFMGPLGGDLGLLQPYVHLGGIITWFAWHLQPRAWLYLYFALTGFVRAMAFLITREAVAEPALWLPLRTAQWLRNRYRRLRRSSKLGPVRPDRAFVEAGCDLVILSSREKPEWDELATIRVGERFYQLADVEERSDGRWQAIAYRLNEIAGRDIGIKLLTSDVEPPAELPGGPKRARADRAWYFAYGAAMELETLRAAVPSARFVSVAKCSGYRLSFERPAADGSGVATAIRTNNPGDAVWGVVWEFEETNLAAIDPLEGIGPGCRWHEIEARDRGGDEYLVRLSVSEVASLDRSLAPSRQHRDEVVRAARHHGLPRQYVSLLAAARVAGPGAPR